MAERTDIESGVLSIVRSAERLFHIAMIANGVVFLLGVGAIWAFLPWSGAAQHIAAAVVATVATLVVCGLLSNALTFLIVQLALLRLGRRFPRRDGTWEQALACLVRVDGPRQLACKMRLALDLPVGTTVAPEDQVAAALAPLPAPAPPAAVQETPGLRRPAASGACIPLEPAAPEASTGVLDSGRIVFLPVELRPDDGKPA